MNKIDGQTPGISIDPDEPDPTAAEIDVWADKEGERLRSLGYESRRQEQMDNEWMERTLSA